METVKKVYDQYVNVMDQDILAVQVGCYSVALLGLTAAIRRVRPFSRFKRPNDIPNHFVEEKRELLGHVKRIEPNGLLMVEHHPLIPLPIVPRGELPVKILGVKVSGLGISWLQAIVAESEIKFIPLIKDKEYVHCTVLLPNRKTIVKETITKDKRAALWKKLSTRSEAPFIDVAENLTKIGFAEVEAINGIQYTTYIKSLESAQLYALKRKLGFRYYSNQMQTILIHLTWNLISATQKSLKKLFISTKNFIPKAMTPA